MVLKKEKIVFGLLFLAGTVLYFFTEISYAPLFLTGICVYGIVGFIVSGISGKKTDLHFDGEKQCEKGSQPEVILHMKNNSKIPIWNGEILLRVKNKLDRKSVV